MQERFLLLFALVGIGLAKNYYDRKAFIERVLERERVRERVRERERLERERLSARDRVRRKYGLG